jgi:hypothetical protein
VILFGAGEEMITRRNSSIIIKVIILHKYFCGKDTAGSLPGLKNVMMMRFVGIVSTLVGILVLLLLVSVHRPYQAGLCCHQEFLLEFTMPCFK